MESQGEVNWLVSSAGRRVELCNLLKRTPSSHAARVVAIDSNPAAPTRFSSDFFFEVPPVENRSFVGRVGEICDSLGVKFLIPTIDTELSRYSSHREAVEKSGATVLVSDYDFVSVTLDKLAFYERLALLGLPTIPTFSDPDQMDASIQRVVIAKPRFGSSGGGFRVLSSKEEVALLDSSIQWVFQPLAHGREVSVDFGIGSDGKLLGYGARSRTRVRAGEVIDSITVSNPQIESFLLEFISQFSGMFGVLNLQLFEHDGILTVLEVNARVGGGYPLTDYAGAELFRMFATGEMEPMMRAESDVRMLRHDCSFFLNGPNQRGEDYCAHRF